MSFDNGFTLKHLSIMTVTNCLVLMEQKIISIQNKKDFIARSDFSIYYKCRSQ